MSMTHRVKFLLLLFLIFSIVAKATNYVFTGTGNWTTSGNWSPSYPAAPAVGDSLIIDGNCTISANLNVPPRACRITGNGSLIVSGGNCTFNSTLLVNAGATITILSPRQLQFGTAATSLTQIDGSMTVNGGATLRYSGNSSHVGVIGLTGNINVSGTFIYGADNIRLTNNGVITINSGGQFTIGPTRWLTNNGTFTNNGSFLINSTFASTACTLNGIFGGSGSYIFQGTTAGSLSGTMTLPNLELNNSAGATIASGANKLNLTGLLKLTSGTLTTNGNLVLKSTSSTATAMVGAVPASGAGISGNVIQERYITQPSGIGNTGRAWRLVSFPGRGSSNNSIYYNWQNNGTVTAGEGAEIWSPAGTNGLAAGPQYSMRTYDNTTNQYVGVSNTQSTALFDATTNKAFLLFVSGQYGSGNISSGAGATTLKGTSALITGTQTYTFTAPNATNSYSLIGNPYACPIDFDDVYSNSNTANINRKFWTIDPNLNTIGGYVTVTWDGVSAYSVAPSSSQNQYIQTGQAFFVEATTPNTLSTVEIQENDKETGAAQTDVFRTNGGNMETLRINLNKASGSGYGMVDGTLVNGHQSLSNAIGSGDAAKFGNFSENISIYKGGNSYLAIEGRQLLDNNDTVVLAVSNMQQVNYQLEFEPGNMNVPGLTAVLIDNFTNTSIPVSLTSNTIYSFSITGNTASTGTNRFKVVFSNLTPLSLKFLNVSARKRDSSVMVDWKSDNEANITHYEVERSGDGKRFDKIGTVSCSQQTAYSFEDEAPLKVTNYYRIKALARNANGVYSNIVHVNTNAAKTFMHIYPNPAKGSTIQIEVSNLNKGIYSISIYNTAGQKIAGKQLSHEGVNTTIADINIENLATGTYIVRLSNEAGVMVNEQKIVKP